MIACKAIFNRPKDWLDIENMLANAPEDLDAGEARKWISTIAGADVTDRLAASFVRYGFSAKKPKSKTRGGPHV